MYLLHNSKYPSGAGIQGRNLLNYTSKGVNSKNEENHAFH